MTNTEKVLCEVFHDYYMNWTSCYNMAGAYGLSENEIEKLLARARTVKSEYQDEYNKMFNL